MKAWILLPAQIFLTGLITYVAIATWTSIGGAYTEGLQVIGFAFFSTPLTVLVFLLGLPLRLAPPVRLWWLQHAGWTFALFGVAACGMVLSYFVGDAGPVHYVETVAWPATDGYEPDARLFLPSLVVLAFATMHLRPPLRRRPAGGLRDGWP
ncbi:hypothetical protein CQ042_19830 [Microbacterium sp. MYb62]|nr:hypothetical protein CQ042_19830 [Microbacterium sp. MYb62]